MNISNYTCKSFFSVNEDNYLQGIYGEVDKEIKNLELGQIVVKEKIYYKTALKIGINYFWIASLIQTLKNVNPTMVPLIIEEDSRFMTGVGSVEENTKFYPLLKATILKDCPDSEKEAALQSRRVVILILGDSKTIFSIHQSQWEKMNKDICIDMNEENSTYTHLDPKGYEITVIDHNDENYERICKEVFEKKQAE